MMGSMLENPPDHPTHTGDKFIGIGKVGPMRAKMVWTVADSARPLRWVGELVAAKPSRIIDFGTITTTYEFAETDGGTRVELRCAWAPHALASLVSKLYLEGYERRMAQHMTTNLKRILEGGDAHAHHH